MTRICPLQPGLPPSQTRDFKDTGGTGFQETLQQTLQARQSPQQVPTGAGALGEVRPAQMPTIENGSDALVAGTGRLIDLLDAYARQLADPTKSLRQIAPLVVEIQTQAERLMAAADSEPHPEPELQTLAARSAVAAKVEVIRFQRGDYV